MKVLADNSLPRRLEDVRSNLETVLFNFDDVAAVSVKSAVVKVCLVHDSQRTRSRINKIVREQHPGADLEYEITGPFRSL